MKAGLQSVFTYGFLRRVCPNLTEVAVLTLTTLIQCDIFAIGKITNFEQICPSENLILFSLRNVLIFSVDHCLLSCETADLNLCKHFTFLSKLVKIQCKMF